MMTGKADPTNLVSGGSTFLHSTLVSQLMATYLITKREGGTKVVRAHRASRFFLVPFYENVVTCLPCTFVSSRLTSEVTGMGAL